jgi:hypothetical protein
MIFLLTKKSMINRKSTLRVAEMPTAQGLRLTAIRSGTGIGFEVSSSGGSLGGKKTSRMLA